MRKGIGYHRPGSLSGHWDCGRTDGESVKFEPSISLDTNNILRVNGYDYSYKINLRTYHKEEESYE